MMGMRFLLITFMLWWITKKAKKLLVIACLGGVGYLLVKALKIDAVREKLFEVMDEDLYLAIKDKLYLLGDLLMWPIDFVRALLP